MKVRPAALVVRDGTVLTMRYQYGEEHVYVLPGGNPDPGESLTEALVRELSEELGVEASVGEMLFAGEVLNFNQKEDMLHCLFRVEIDSGTEPELNKAHTTAQALEWIEPRKLAVATLYPNFAPYLVERGLSSRVFSYTGPLLQLYRG